MEISYFIVHISAKEVKEQHGIIAEIVIYLNDDYYIAGFKYTKEGWVIPKQYSYLSGEKTPSSIFSSKLHDFLISRLTLALLSVKLVLTVDSYGKSYRVDSKGATLMAQSSE
jgi:hypothetical protein